MKGAYYTLQPMDLGEIHIVAEEERFASERGRLLLTTFNTPAGPVERPILRHPGAVAIIAQANDASNAEKKLLMVRQFRYPTETWTWEIPAGTRTPSESALVTAQRELAEEAGYQAGQWQELNSCYPAIGISDESLTFFQAQQLTPSLASADHGEFVSARWMSASEIETDIQAGHICDAKTLLALFMLGYDLPGWSSP